MSEPRSLAGAGPFADTTLRELADRLRNGSTSAEKLTGLALEAAHGIGAELNCFTVLDDERALEAARRADRELAVGHDRGPLHGIPFGVKDLIATAGLRTTLGSAHFADNVPGHDAAVVTLLKDAGAVVVGKTHTHEFAFGPTGDTAHTGPAVNPHDMDRMTGGSSSGSAAALAAGIVPAALGTDTGGSVRIPAALCGIAGLRPGQGRIDTAGAYPLAPSFDVVGPMARSARDVAVIWSVLAGDTGASGGPAGTGAPRGADGLRIATVACDLVGRVTPSQAAVCSAALAAFARAGAETPEIALPQLDRARELYVAIQSSEAFALHEQRVGHAPELFCEEVLGRLLAARKVAGWEYVRALRRRERARREVLPLLETVDAVLMPTVPIEAPLIGQRELDGADGWDDVRQALLGFTLPWSVLDCAAVSVPVARTDSVLPGSVQLVGLPGREHRLMEIAALLEAELAVPGRAGDA